LQQKIFAINHAYQSFHHKFVVYHMADEKHKPYRSHTSFFPKNRLEKEYPHVDIQEA